MMETKATVEESMDGRVEVFVKTNKGIYKLWVIPEPVPMVEVMVDGVLQGRAKADLEPLEE